MPICPKCHTRISKKKYARHRKTCIPIGSKGFEHFKVTKSFATDDSGKRITHR